MKYSVNNIALLKDGRVGTINKTELIEGKGYYTLSFGETEATVRTTDIKAILGNVLSEVSGRSREELVKYFKGKKVSVKELKKFYGLLAQVKIVEDIIDVDTNINGKSDINFEDFSKWFSEGKVKEKSSILLNPYVGYVKVKVDDKTYIKMLIAKLNEDVLFPLFYQVNDLQIQQGPCVINISQKWSMTPMDERNARAFRTAISQYTNMLFLNEEKCFIRKEDLPKSGDIVKMKNYTPDNMPGYLNAINLYFSGKDIKIKVIDNNGNVVFHPVEKDLKKQDYFCLVTDLMVDDIFKHCIMEPRTQVASLS